MENVNVSSQAAEEENIIYVKLMRMMRNLHLLYSDYRFALVSIIKDVQ